MKPDWKRIAFIFVLAAGLVTSVAADEWDDSWDDNGWDNGGWDNGGWDDGDWDDEGWDNDWTPGATGSTSLSGYLETTGLTVLPRIGKSGEVYAGLQNVLRLRGRFEPAPSLSVTVETEFIDRRGATDPAVRRGIIGLPDDPDGSDDGPQGNGTVPGSSTPELVVDYLYGSAAFGPVDLRIGRQPLAWGTAYAFNPTDLMNPSSLADLAGLEPPGLTAVFASLTLGQRWGLEGYLGFEDRSRNAGAVSELDRVENLPFGVRARAFLGMWDLGLGLVRAAEYSGCVATSDYAVFEIAGALWDLLVYGESSIELGANDWSVDKHTDLALGVQWDALDELSLQLEYHRRGGNATDSAKYPPAERLRGELVGRDYLVGIGTLSLLDDNVGVILAAMNNLNDRSVVFLPEVTWRGVEDFELGLGASVFLGPDGSEFNGRIDDDHLGDLDTGRPQVYARMTWYF